MADDYEAKLLRYGYLKVSPDTKYVALNDILKRSGS